MIAGATHSVSCVITTVLPAAVIAPVRLTPVVFAATENVVVPLPLPLDPPVIAIQAALLEGSLSAERWTSYVQLQRELHALDVRRDHLLRREQVREYKIRAKQQRSKKR